MIGVGGEWRGVMVCMSKKNKIAIAQRGGRNSWTIELVGWGNMISLLL